MIKGQASNILLIINSYYRSGPQSKSNKAFKNKYNKSYLVINLFTKSYLSTRPESEL